MLISLSLPAFAQDFYNVKFIKNYDGDTFTFDLGSGLPDLFRTIPVRLYGIDTPEIKSRTKAATDARDFAHNEITNAKQVNLVECSKDKYFRILCKIQYDGKDLTTELLNRDMGYAYYGGKKQAY